MYVTLCAGMTGRGCGCLRLLLLSSSPLKPPANHPPPFKTRSPWLTPSSTPHAHTRQGCEANGEFDVHGRGHTAHGGVGPALRARLQPRPHVSACRLTCACMARASLLSASALAPTHPLPHHTASAMTSTRQSSAMRTWLTSAPPYGPATTSPAPTGCVCLCACPLLSVAPSICPCICICVRHIDCSHVCLFPHLYPVLSPRRHLYSPRACLPPIPSGILDPSALPQLRPAPNRQALLHHPLRVARARLQGQSFLAFITPFVCLGVPVWVGNLWAP
jgi:hypothetical protein